MIEPWPGFYIDPKLVEPERSNYALRESHARLRGGAGPAASPRCRCCGANPGMVSWFVKQALLDVATRPRR